MTKRFSLAQNLSIHTLLILTLTCSLFASGVTLKTGENPTFINAQGQPFVAKGIIYYQPKASHQFFLRNLDLSIVRRDLQKFKKTGFNTIGIDVSWGELIAEVDPKNNYTPTRFHNDRIEKLKKLAQIAQEEGVYLYVSPGIQNLPMQVPSKDYAPSFDKHGNFYPAFNGYLIRNWQVDPAINQGFLTYLEFTGKILKPYKNVLCYALYFELMEQQFPWCHEDPLLIKAWQKYLKDKNPKIKYWNKRWDENYKSFKEISLPYRDRSYWKIYYDKVLEIDPIESHPLMWRDCYDFMMVAIGWDGKYGMSFKQMSSAIRKGDPDALVAWKPHDPIRYAWELGCLPEYQNGTTPTDAEDILKKTYSYPGIDIITLDGYPNAYTDPKQRANELSFKPNYNRAKEVMKISPLPFYCQEFGINHHQWSSYECKKYLVNALKGYQELNAIGYNIWQSQDYYKSTISDDIQPNFGIFDVNGDPYPAIEALTPLLGGEAEKKVSTVWDKYLEDNRLKYHGYFLHDDPLEHKAEIEKLAEFSNIIFVNSFDIEGLPSMAPAQFFLSNLKTADSNFFQKASQRLTYVDSLGFDIISEFPAYLLLTDCDKQNFIEILQYFKQRVPELDLVDYFYIADEPDINPIAEVKTLTIAIDAMKEVFPNAKSTICYAIPEPRMLDTKIPHNVDLLMIDPYFLRDYTGKTTAKDFEIFYRSRLAPTLSWVNKWDKPFLIIGDAFWSIKENGKIPPTPKTSLWFYQTALLQPNCIGLGWFLYGSLQTDEGLRGLSFDDPNSAELLKVHKEIGEQILAEPSLMGVAFHVSPVKIPDKLQKAIEAKQMKEKQKLHGLYVENGKLMRKGKTYFGVGVNYFDPFYRVITDPNNTDYNDKGYKEGFRILREKYDIPFIRFNAGGYWPTQWQLYLNDKEKYFEIMDELIAEAEKQNLGLIPSLFWFVACVPDIVHEPMDQIGVPESKTTEFFKTYTKEFVSRYKDSSAIWAWEFGNEHILAASILKSDKDPMMGLPQIEPQLGTPSTRTERDRIKRDNLRNMYRIFADQVRKIDKCRMITTGDALTSENSYHRYYLNSWDTDTKAQWTQMFIQDSPTGIDSISVHLYPMHDNSYFEDKVKIEDVIKHCNKIANIEGKPLFIGEFGAPIQMGKEKEKEFFFRVVNSIRENSIPLSALWVYDFDHQNADWNVTHENQRSYMLDAIKQLNADLNSNIK